MANVEDVFNFKMNQPVKMRVKSASQKKQYEKEREELKGKNSNVKMNINNCSSQTLSYKSNKFRKNIGGEKFVRFNKFSILKNEEVNVKDNSCESLDIPPNNFEQNVKEKKKRKKKEQRKNKVNMFKIKQIENELNNSNDQVPILRCYNCLKTHFPSKKICQLWISKELKNGNLPETKLKPVLLETETLNLLLYSIKYLELKNLIDVKCTCKEPGELDSSKDVSGNKIVQLKGGYGKESRTSSILIKSAIQSANKHGICLVEGKVNDADGNCAFDAVINNVNNRKCFHEKLLLSSTTYRQIWVTELEQESANYPRLGAGFSLEEREENWNHLKQSGVYEVEFFGDLVIHAIAKGCKKNILIFNTSVDAADPIYVIRAGEFGGYVDSDIPVVIGYNQVHYESLHPVTEADIKKTKDLVNSYISGNYQFGKKDIEFLISCTSVENQIKDSAQSKFSSSYDMNFPTIHTSMKKQVTKKKQVASQNKECKCMLTLDQLKKIPAKKRKGEEIKRYKHLIYMKRKEKITQEQFEKENETRRQNKVEVKANETEQETMIRRKNEKEAMQILRAKQTKEEVNIRRKKDKEQTKQKRLNDSPVKKLAKTEAMKKRRVEKTHDEKAALNENDRKRKKQERINESQEKKAKRCKKNQLNMRNVRNNSSEIKRLNKFTESVKYGPIFTCNVCEQDMFLNNVSVLTEDFKKEIGAKSSELYKIVFQDKHKIEIIRSINQEELRPEVNFYICTTCKKHLKKGSLPAMSASNGLNVVNITDKDLQLTELESNLIAKTILFQKIYQLPRSRMAACKDRLINIPIGSDDVINTLECLPRTPKEAGLIEVKLKRKLEYKNNHQQAFIDPQKIFKALEFLKSSGHPDYKFYDDYNVYQRRCRKNELKAIFVDDLNSETMVDKEEYQKRISKVPELTDDECSDTEDEDSDAEDEKYRKTDVIRKFQFDYNASVCLVDKFPEAALTEELLPENSNQISFAPGEGKTPENILNSKNWDIKAFPMKHPDGKYSLHQERSKKLSDQYYFVQRLRNTDQRFSTDPAYVFAAAAYLEKKQLQRNINVSYQRGKEVTSKTGPSTYHLEDGFSVFDSISNTPKYWKTAKYEMLAKLDNLGPFHFFFTLSCADKRWDENLSSILRKLNITVVYDTNSEGVEEILIKDEEKQLMKMKEYLEKHVDSSLHELIRRNVFIATRNYNNRVNAFIRDIITDKNNPMCVKYWSTKVEFQGRGAGHNHGTLWVDIEKIELTYVDNDCKWFDLDSLIELSECKGDVKQELSRLLAKFNVDKKPIEENDAQILHDIFRNIFETDNSQPHIEEGVEDLLKRFPLFGLSSAFKKFQTKEDLMDHEESAIIKFANKFTTCTLNKSVIEAKTEDKELKKRAADVVNIIRECYIHSHTSSCRKYHTECRFKFAKFPIWKTILARPLKVIEGSGEDIQKKYSEILTRVKEVINDKEIINSILEEWPKDLDISVELYEENRQKRIVKLLNIAGYHSEDEIQLYEEALKFSTPGYSLIMERDIDEIFVNSYNIEWARAWNGNTDLQICFDYFAVITYITEYYCKDDTGMMTKLIEMLKNSECETLKEKMILVMNTFISARQMGECEAYYKIMPDFHLKDSNVATVFVPTSRKELRSKFMIRVDEKEKYNGREKKKIHEKEGWYVEKYDVIDKYIRRDKTCKGSDEVCPAQFLKMFSTSHEMKIKKKLCKHENTSDKVKIEKLGKFHNVMRASSIEPMLLPDYIAIENPFPGEPHFMKKRSKPAVLRFHKTKKNVDPASYFFAEALLYTSFRTEEELEIKVNNAAQDNYEQLGNEIHKVKSKVMEYLESNDEARYMVEEAFKNNDKTGEILDAEGEQEIADCEQEDLLLHPDYEHINPEDLHITEQTSKFEKVYRPIVVDDLKLLKEKTRSLDFYQRKVIERGIKYSRSVVKSLKNKNPPPQAKIVIVHGGAGCGKSTVINVLKQWCHLILQQPGDDPDCPYIIVAAPTGTAAAHVRGQTMHTAFGFSFGNEFYSLSDKVRDKKRNLLKNLRILLIDEVSMVKSDQQFQLDKRLREVTQKVSKLFGGIKIFLFGDIMQLKPCMGRYIFEEPINSDFKMEFHLGTHWPSYEVITLEENHRQGEDREYADMLNRFRIGQQNEHDMQKLQSRVRPLNHADLNGAVFISCKNKEVEKLNMKRLNEIKGEMVAFEAINIHPTIKNVKPKIGNKGNVMDTPFLQTLKLKKGARIQLTYNINTLDCLTNGTRGEVTDFLRNKTGHIEKNND